MRNIVSKSRCGSTLLQVKLLEFTSRKRFWETIPILESFGTTLHRQCAFRKFHSALQFAQSALVANDSQFLVVGFSRIINDAILKSSSPWWVRHDVASPLKTPSSTEMCIHRHRRRWLWILTPFCLVHILTKSAAIGSFRSRKDLKSRDFAWVPRCLPLSVIKVCDGSWANKEFPIYCDNSQAGTAVSFNHSTNLLRCLLKRKSKWLKW